MKKFCFLVHVLFFGIGIQGQSLIGVNVDDLSDAQVLSIFEKGRAQGLTIENGEEIAINYGLSKDQALKFKTRLALIENPGIMSSESSDIRASIDAVEVESKKKNEEKNIVKEEPDSTNIFGHTYFNADLGSFDKRNGAKAPSNYILGSGDELTISVFGSSYFQETFQVSESGVLNLGPNFGRLKIRGMLFKNVKKLLRARFARSFDLTKNTFDLSLTYGRNISINIVGEVNNPGTYSLTALNNTFHALVAAGGPTKIGSLRNVKVYRAGDVIETIDFYKFFINPDGFKIPFLQDGDFLMIPTAKNLVSASGAFKRNMIFEMLPNETVSDLINFSSGFSANAYNKKIQVFRSNNSEKKIIDVESKYFSSLTLNDGDSVYANVKNGKLENFISIEGALAQPGVYGYVLGMTLRDAINLAGGVMGKNIDKEVSLSRLMSNGFYEINRMNLSNEESLGSKLSPSDNIFIGSKSLDSKEKIVSVIGAVNNPGEFIYSKGMTLEEALNRAGGLKMYSDDKRIEITRQTSIQNENGFQEIQKSSTILSLDPLIKENWSDQYKESGYLLEPFDEISIRRIKKYGLNEKVYVSGALEFPGIYSILSDKERVSDVISRAGGVSADADISNGMFFRKGKNGVVFDLQSALNEGSSNYIISDLDSLFIPKKSELIGITGDGHMYFDEFGESTLNVPFIKAERAIKYINNFSLGLSKQARKKDIFVSYPNGELDRSKNILIFWTRSPKVRVGGVIHAVKKVAKTKKIKERKPLDWNQLVATVTSAAMGFGTVYAIINRP